LSLVEEPRQEQHDDDRQQHKPRHLSQAALGPGHDTVHEEEDRQNDGEGPRADEGEASVDQDRVGHGRQDPQHDASTISRALARSQGERARGVDPPWGPQRSRPPVVHS